MTDNILEIAKRKKKEGEKLTKEEQNRLIERVMVFEGSISVEEALSRFKIINKDKGEEII